MTFVALLSAGALAAVSSLESRVWGIMFLLFGLYCYIFRKNVAERQERFLQKFPGAKFDAPVLEVWASIAGLAFSVIGLLLALQVIKLG